MEFLFSDFTSGILQAVAKEVHARLKAPKRISETTRYLLDAEERHKKVLSSFPTYSPIYNADENRSQELDRIGSQEPSARLFVDIALKMRTYETELENRRNAINDTRWEEVLNISLRVLENTQRIIISNSIGHCLRDEAAQFLSSLPVIELQGLQPRDEEGFISLEKLKDKLHKKPLLRSPKILSKTGMCREKLFILVHVSLALSKAHSKKWYHRRISTENIFVNERLLSREDTADLRLSSNFTKVGHFLCASTYCFDGCTKCRFENRDRRQILSKDQYFRAIPTVPGHVKVFSRICTEEQFSSGEDMDRVSFSNLVFWMYTGKIRGETGVLREEDQIPWPLRWLLREPACVPMSEVYMFLNALALEKIQPHSFQSMYVRRSERLPEGGLTVDELKMLSHACYRSAMAGFMTRESEPAMHLGRLVEERWVESGAENGILVENEHFYLAKELYQSAFQFGESTGLIQMARIGCRVRGGGINSGSQHVPMEDVLRLVVFAGTYGNNQAVNILKEVAQERKPVEDALLGGSMSFQATEVHFSEKDFLDVVVEIAKNFRRGSPGFPVDLAEAESWLTLASRRNHQEGMLELGLLRMQTSKSHREASESIDLVSAVTNSFPSPAACEAHFWLAWWHGSGLKIENQLEVVEVDIDKALRHATLGAGCNNDAKGYLSSLILGSGEGNMEAFSQMCREAINGGSPQACYARARYYSLQAVAAYRALLDEDEGARESVASRSSRRSSGSGRERRSVRGRAVGDSENDEVDRRDNSLRKRVVQKLMAAVSYLNGECEDLKRILHEEHHEKYNPMPLVAAHDVIRDNCEMWAKCAAPNAKERERETILWNNWSSAVGYLERAVRLKDERMWRRLRVNYITKDTEFFEAAQQKLRETLNWRPRPGMY